MIFELCLNIIKPKIFISMKTQHWQWLAAIAASTLHGIGAVEDQGVVLEIGGVDNRPGVGHGHGHLHHPNKVGNSIQNLKP